MQSPFAKPKFTWSILIVGACCILFLLACRLTASPNSASYPLKALKNNQAANTKISRQEALLESLTGWAETGSEDGGWTPATAGQVLRAGQHVRTGDLSSVSLVFYDGSQVDVKSNSEISIDEVNIEKQRVIVLTQVSGESEHDVATNEQEGSRYEVNSPSGVGLAKGTRFRVNVTPDKAAFYIVTEGVVVVTGMETTVEVKAGEETVIYDSQPPLLPVVSISLQGILSVIGETWVIDGQSYLVGETTIITGIPRVGDLVLVEGRQLADGTKTADWIILLHASLENQFRLSGAVESTGNAAWKINGQYIKITETTAISALIAVGNMVEVEGIVLPGGGLQASSIEKIDSTAGLPFHFTGVVQETGDESWTISKVLIFVSTTTSISENLKTGERVQVKGTIQQDGTWLATSITRLDTALNQFAFTGKLESQDPWKAAGILFETRSWTEMDAGLKVGDLVRVEGEILPDGTWVASSFRRVVDDAPSTMILIGTVFSTNPWIISGIHLEVTGTTVIEGDIKAGMVVRVEITLVNGVWQITRVQRLTDTIWFPGCMEVVATVVSLQDRQVQLQDWPLLELDDDVKVEGVLAPNSVVRMQICFGEDNVIKITYIIIVSVQPEPGEPPAGEDEGGKVTVCHKPGKKGGGHTLSIGRSALPAHLGHGDYQGACR